MKNLVITMFLLSVNFFYAQDFIGKATYKSFTKVTINPKHVDKNMDEASRKKMEERLSKKLQKTYTLNFSKSKSSYTQDEKLESQTQSRDKIMIIGNGKDTFFKDISKRIFAHKKDMFGKVFLIKDSLPMSVWEMTNETKKIGEYTCYKATKSKEKERVSFIITDGKNEPHKEKVTVITAAWYTPEIPVSNGPENYWGLPGLILEIEEGKKTILCSELVLNPSKKIKIEAPKKGEKVTQKEFDDVMKIKEKEIMERFKMKGGGINIQTQ